MIMKYQSTWETHVTTYQEVSILHVSLKNCHIFIKITHLVPSPNSRVTSQYLIQLWCINDAPGTWVLEPWGVYVRS